MYEIEFIACYAPMDNAIFTIVQQWGVFLYTTWESGCSVNPCMAKG